TIFRSPDAVRRMLRENALGFQEALEFVQEKEEWGVKGFAHRGCLREAALRRDPELCEMAEKLAVSARNRPGSAFFLKRRMDDLAEQRRMEREAELIQAAATALRDSVVQLASLPSPRIQGEGEEMVLNLACLVLRDAVQPFLAEVRRWNEAAEDHGLRLVASGPWPPYNFSPRLGNDAR
ncbi:MAG: GvpL/GvpF family gas vesicle protein, partial [candidate division NC10 bacterium]